jgi:anti-sigma B factor antagonist
MSGMRRALPAFSVRSRNDTGRASPTAAASTCNERPGRVMDLTLCVRPCDRGTVVWVSGEVDVSAAGPLQDLLLRIMRTHNPRLLLDLSGISFMDCAGLQALVLTRRRAELRRGSMRLIAASAVVHRMLNLARLRHIFPVHDHWTETGGGNSSPPERVAPAEAEPFGQLAGVRLTDDTWVIGADLSGSYRG